MKKVCFSAAVLLPLFLGACFVDWTQPEWKGDLGGGTPQVSTTLFSNSDIAGEKVFSTNDINISRPFGKSYWLPQGSEVTTFREYKIEAVKVGGDSSAGFGMIFCHGTEESMLTAMIRTDGFFQVAEVAGGTYKPMADWNSHSAIRTGFGQRNTLRVTRDDLGQFAFYVNDQKIYEFTDDEEPVHSGGRQGYLVVVSPREDFPKVPVDVRFRPM